MWRFSRLSASSGGAGAQTTETWAEQITSQADGTTFTAVRWSHAGIMPVSCRLSPPTDDHRSPWLTAKLQAPLPPADWPVSETRAGSPRYFSSTCLVRRCTCHRKTKNQTIPNIKLPSRWGKLRSFEEPSLSRCFFLANGPFFFPFKNFWLRCLGQSLCSPADWIPSAPTLWHHLGRPSGLVSDFSAVTRVPW